MVRHAKKENVFIQRDIMLIKLTTIHQESDDAISGTDMIRFPVNWSGETRPFSGGLFLRSFGPGFPLYSDIM